MFYFASSKTAVPPETFNNTSLRAFVNQCFEGVNKTVLAFQLMQISQVFGWLCQNIFLFFNLCVVFIHDGTPDTVVALGP